jgi:hypothetical protein
VDGRDGQGVLYEAFVEGKLEAPKPLVRRVHDLYFEPQYEEFKSRTIWSLSGVHSALKELGPLLSSRPLPSWANSWKPGFHSRSNRAVSADRPFTASLKRPTRRAYPMFLLSRRPSDV